jgi:hypothetical protein
VGESVRTVGTRQVGLADADILADVEPQPFDLGAVVQIPRDVLTGCSLVSVG